MRDKSHDYDMGLPNPGDEISSSLDNNVRILYTHDFEDIIAGFGGQK
jgi:hypothetical protein